MKVHTNDLPEVGETVCPVCSMPGVPTEDERGTLIRHLRRRWPCRTSQRGLLVVEVETGGAA